MYQITHTKEDLSALCSIKTYWDDWDMPLNQKGNYAKPPISLIYLFFITLSYIELIQKELEQNVATVVM